MTNFHQYNTISLKSKFVQYNSPTITDNNNTICKIIVGAVIERPRAAGCRPLRKANKEIDLYMKATGIVRRIDDLGRVVIPKEIRRTMRIREGDPLITH